MKILLVEDDPVARTVLTRILSGHPDIRVTAAEDGEAAWNLVDDPHRTFDLVLLDLSLPKIDGFGVLERMRGNPLTRNLTVVLCTASNDRSTVIRAVGLGVRHYLVKPCTEAAVMAKLSQLGLTPAPAASMVAGTVPVSPPAPAPDAAPAAEKKPAEETVPAAEAAPAAEPVAEPAAT